MKKSLLLLIGLAAAWGLQAQTYAPIPLTGFTDDVVANGSGSALTSSTNDVDGVQFTFMAQNFVNPSSQSPTSALPNSGLINSAATSGLTFQLAPFTGNNSLRISGTGSGTLTFATPRLADQVYVLATSGSGTSAVSITITFTDATTQVFTQTIADWYNGSSYAIQGISRVNRTNNVIENSATNPRLYQYLLPISTANTGKSIQSISFNKTSSGGVLNVMGITIRAIASSIANDAGVSSIVSPVSGCGLTAQETVTVTITNYGSAAQSNIPVSYRLNNGTAVTEIFAGPLASNATANYSFTTKANLSNLGSYSLVASANLPNDGATTNDYTTKTVVAAAAPNAPVVSASGGTAICPGTVAVLSASGVPGASFQWYKNGVVITGAASVNYAATTAGTYTAVANANGCSSPVSNAIAIIVNPAPATPTVSVTGSLSLCSGDSVTLTAASSPAGATYSWLLNGTTIAGATGDTYYAKAPGRYSVMVTANGCTSNASPAALVTVNATPVTPSVSQSGNTLTSSSGVGNQWYFNGNPIPGATSQTFTAATNGSYTVVVTNNGCSSGASSPVNLVISSVAKTLSAYQIELYPNPASDWLQVTVPGAENSELMITDLTGRLILKQRLTGPDTRIDITAVAKGLYLVHLKTSRGMATEKLLIE